MVKALTAPDDLDIAPFSNPLRSELLSALTEEQLGEGMHVVSVSGEVRTGSEALPLLIGAIAPLLRNVRTMDGALRRSYVVISSKRGQLARVVPNVEPVVRVTGT